MKVNGSICQKKYLADGFWGENLSLYYFLRRRVANSARKVRKSQHSGWCRFEWLDTVASFSFSGKYAQLTVRKEPRQHGETYWYAYRRNGQKMSKRYLGRTSELTLTRLEEVARELAATAPRSTEEIPTRGLQQEPDRGQRPAAASSQRSRQTCPLPPVSSGEQADLELRTKIHPPRLRPQLVARAHLLRRLQQASNPTLTLLSAPPGFGKTTLLVQWLTESALPVAWLSLEPQGDEPVRFLSYLIAAGPTTGS
jgi:LuxR family maltose regulon positive regulatory protein